MFYLEPNLKFYEIDEIIKLLQSKERLVYVDDVTDRTIARYISELKDKGIIERKGPDNGGEWKII